jgi:hypothetical protein
LSSYENDQVLPMKVSSLKGRWGESGSWKVIAIYFFVFE